MQTNVKIKTVSESTDNTSLITIQIPTDDIPDFISQFINAEERLVKKCKEALPFNGMFPTGKYSDTEEKIMDHFLNMEYDSTSIPIIAEKIQVSYNLVRLWFKNNEHRFKELGITKSGEHAATRYSYAPVLPENKITINAEPPAQQIEKI
jgi:hypothetical protein